MYGDHPLLAIDADVEPRFEQQHCRNVVPAREVLAKVINDSFVCTRQVTYVERDQIGIPCMPLATTRLTKNRIHV